MFLMGGRALDNVGPITLVPKLTKLRIPQGERGSQYTRAKLRGQEGNIPERRSRSQSLC